MLTSKIIKQLWMGLIFAAGAMLNPGVSQAALLGLSPAEPTIDFPSSGIISYHSATGLVTISGTPATLFRSNPFLFANIVGASPDDEKLISIQFYVDMSGNLVSGIGGGPDLIVKGAVDVNGDGIIDFDGVLLQANISQFGFQDGGPGGTDFFDVRLTAVGGLLASYYTGSDLAISIVSENVAEYPTPFNGSWAVDFTAQAKGLVGSVALSQPASCGVSVEALCSVNGSPNASKCRIKVAKAAEHWDRETRTNQQGTTYNFYSYGMHGDPVPTWVQRSPGTSVTFSYVLQNTGTTTVTSLQVQDSFDSPVTGVPVSLVPGQSATVTRTQVLREGIEDEVVFSAMYQGAMCGAHDDVVIKDLIRQRRRHDYDNFEDKGMGDQQSYK